MSDPELKIRATEAFEKLTRRIGRAQGILLNQLEGSVAENYRHFTAENDIKCPIAQTMKTAYQRINVMRMDERPKERKGIYKGQCAELITTLTTINNGKPSLVDAISTQVKTRQTAKWQAIQQDFIIAVLSHFAQALAGLRDNGSHMSGKQKRVRELLGLQFVQFSHTLKEVKGMFPDSEMQRATKKARTVKVKQEANMLSGS